MFHNYASEQLVDDLGQLQAEIAALSERADGMKAELRKRAVDAVTGARFKAAIGADSMVATLDRKKLEAELGELTRFMTWGKRAGAVRLTPIRAAMAEAA